MKIQRLSLYSILILACAAPGLTHAQAPAGDSREEPSSAIFESDYSFDLRPGETVDIKPGAGFDMSDPLFPVRRTAPFLSHPRENPPQNDKPTDLLMSQASYYESNDSKSEAMRLSVAFSGKYKIVKASAALELAEKEVAKKTVAYVEISRSTPGERLAGAVPTWTQPPAADALGDPDEARKQMLLDYGSHYVTDIYYGQRIIIRATYEEKNTEKSLKFRGAVQAVTAVWNVKASLSEEQTAILSSDKTEIQAVIISGGVSPDTASFRFSFPDVMSLLAELKAGTVTVKSGPVRCAVKTYWNTLRPGSMSRMALGRRPQPAPAAPHGVPKGTIIAWLPGSDAITVDKNGVSHITPPTGWAICDGSAPNVPNLKGRFLMGATDYASLNQQTGSPTHHHEVVGQTDGHEARNPLDTSRIWVWESGQSSTTTDGQLSDRAHRHAFRTTSDTASNIPPALTVLYIMRVAD